jgi:hypothetical protein
MLAALPAFADLPPDPTRISPAPVEELPRVKDVCDLDLRCRIARFRSELAHQRRQEYLARLNEASLAMEKRIQKGKPFRTRHPYEANFVYLSNIESFGILAGYVDNYHSDGRFNGFHGGIDVRFLMVKFPLSPYVSTGWAYLNGKNNYSYYGSVPQGSIEAHLITLGTGLELTVPYFHFSLGYQYQEAFYAQSMVDGHHDSTLRDALKSAMAADRHGAMLEIGCAF